MSMRPSAMAEVADLRRRLADAEARLRRMPVRFGRGGSGGGVIATPVWQVYDGPLLTYLNCMGIVRRSDSVLASELPAGTGGTSGQTVLVPAWPSHPTLPAGMGVVRQINSAEEVYAFVLNDARQGVASPDLIAGQIVLGAGWVDLDVPSGGVTYRYACLIPASGWW